MLSILRTDPFSGDSDFDLIKKNLGTETFLPVDTRPNGRPLFADAVKIMASNASQNHTYERNRMAIITVMRRLGLPGADLLNRRRQTLAHVRVSVVSYESLNFVHYAVVAR